MLFVSSSLLPIPLTFFLPRISGFVLQMEMLFPKLNICLGQCQVKTWCLSSRDAATMVADSLHEVGGINVREEALIGKCDDAA